MRRRSALFAVALLLAMTARANAETSAPGAADPATGVMTQINQARAERGLLPLVFDSRLWGLAMDRATRLAAGGVFSHEAAGSVPQGLDATGIGWYRFGEDIGYASGTPDVAATSIFRMWVASPSHWDLMISADFNYLGVGLVYRPSSDVTYASLVMTESPDRTGPQAAIVGAVVGRDDIRWSWRGWDSALQTHTAGLRDFSVQLRVDRGSWLTIASGTAAIARSTPDRIRGHWYGLRVRARDRAGNVGPWSREFRVWLP